MPALTAATRSRRSLRCFSIVTALIFCSHCQRGPSVSADIVDGARPDGAASEPGPMQDAARSICDLVTDHAVAQAADDLGCPVPKNFVATAINGCSMFALVVCGHHVDYACNGSSERSKIRCWRVLKPSGH